MLTFLSIDVIKINNFECRFLANLKPVGKCLIEVCRTGPCWLLGAEDIVRYIEKKLNIKEGQTTSDGMFTLKTVECLASCGTAPMLQIGQKYHENLTIEKCDSILNEYKVKGERVTHWDKSKISH